MKRTTILLFGIASYGIFFLSFLYLIAFLGNLQATPLAEQFPILKDLVPYSIDYGRETGNPVVAVLVNIGLVALFGVQHTVMARQGFKKAWTKIIPAAAERQVYVLLTSLILILMYWQWRPIAEDIWDADTTVTYWLGWAVFGLGFGLVLLSTFLINHFHLFGLQQSLWQFLGRTFGEPTFRTPFLYKVVRHPLYLGWFLAFWGGPVMTCGHMLFAIGMCGYILIAIRYEEKDLKSFHPEYSKYAEQVPMLVPMPGKSYQG
ncbi:MAG: isoprenylcysteine carboxylmethyltransferase family protein [Gammaproteobacteria bacterium]|nr:isoprenylcysteine carboxylmethyltransferase family protein [Gammaproteobacteria bacterium]